MLQVSQQFLTCACTATSCLLLLTCRCSGFKQGRLLQG
jgi:hypothetical protein